jgi:FdhE protein
MQGTSPGLRTDPAARLAELERQCPEWRGWLRPLAETQRVIDDAGWQPRLAQTDFARDLATSAGATSAGAPLLHGRTLEVDAGRVRRLVCRLASTAGTDEGDIAPLHRYKPKPSEAVDLVAAAVRQDRSAITALAEAGGVGPDALASVADLAALPLLHACGRLFGHRVPRVWAQGYCPICGAWPILSERRGLDRTRRLRCGRCAGDWEVEWLCCIYCGEREHERLGSLVLEDGGEKLKVETCAACGGYLKSVATLQGIPAFELFLQDLETVELDLVAMDRGYRRPHASGFPVEARLVARA